MALTLGLIPQWQFSHDPAINFNLNPHLMFPAGMNQLTVQPINNVVQSGDRDLQGRRLGARSWFGAKRGTCPPGCAPLRDGTCECYDVARTPSAMNGLGITMAEWMKPAAAGAGISGVFDSWWWTNRKWLAFGAIGILGLAVAGVATKVLR